MNTESIRNIEGIFTEYSLDTSFAEKVVFYLKLLQNVNKKLNLTGTNSLQEMFDRYILELFILVPFIKKKGCSKILDLGSGAGYAGITFSILFSEKHIVLMDSIQKKVNAVADICREMNLKNVSFIAQRAEAAAHKEDLREKFNLVITRAVAPSNIVLELSAPFVKLGGVYAHYTTLSATLEPDNQALKKLGLTLQKTIPYEKESGKRMQLLKKEKNTPNLYPREYRVIKRSPLYSL